MTHIGLDLGTMNIIRADGSGIDLVRNVFLTLPEGQTSKKQLKKMKVPYIEVEGRLYLIGQEAFDYANIFENIELQRPMQSGLLNPVEQDALPIMRTMIAKLIGTSETGDGVVVYSVPGQTLDMDRKVDYHENVLGEIIESLGFIAKPLNEAVAVANVGLADDNYTGLAASFGSGQVNVCVMYRGMSALQFSLAKSGDWISQQIAADCGISLAKANKIKETQNYSISPTSSDRKTREQQAAKTYYAALIRYALANISHRFSESESTPVFPESVPFVLAGGTAMVNGFVDLFKEQFTQNDFPIDIGDIRLVDEPLTAVSRGCLAEAELEDDDE